ncbi:probable G-protein coupled receptor Mth-like 3 isoform X4 [Trichoplusia ni]|uniref:Probable G-protein coupled receptor Mth-like 3 isoform X4 n=1 Tax=Trichoplusia ni TaxID=7111 RepID=A0A7E5WF60_TRINI|nr:probable G-protein coupled receptor Mth-like 3 isoform X4 [Trichoplusia ni]
MLLFILFLIATCACEQPCPDNESVDISDVKSLDDGTIIQDGVVFPPRYVYAKNVSGEIRRFGCLCKVKNCFRKCCPVGSVIVGRNCTEKSDFDEISNKGLNLHYSSKFRRKIRMKDNDFNMLFGKPCDAVYLEDNKWYVQEDGQLYVDIPENIPSAFIYGPDKYCIDTFVNEKNETQLNALICFVVKPDNNNYAMSSSCMLISCFFILLTVAVYAFLPELRNLHGMVLMAYLLSFFVGFLFFATMQILILKKEIIQRECTILTFIIYFSLLSAFFWLNVMCYDIWWTFSGKRATSGRHGSVMKRFYCYAGYAFGVPTILTVILAALEFSDLPMQHPLLPMLRRQGCFLYGTSKLIYLYGPIVILCVANMIFFTLTAIKIARIKKDTEMLRSKDSSTHDQDRKDTQRFSLYVKLFAVMGVNWILEVVSSFYPEADFFWQFSDAYNVLVGLIIFIIFVCKKKTFKLIKKRVKDFRKANTNNNEVTNISNKIVTRWRKGERNASVETIKTSVGGNTRNTTNDIFQL